MGIRDQLKQREEKRAAAANGGGSGINEGLPEGVTRYVRLGQELGGGGKQFAILADPDNWFFYFVHEDGDYSTRTTYVRKHTCLHSPKAAGADVKAYEKPNGTACISCRAKAKRKMYFLIPVFDFEYNTWRVLDVKEFHAGNLIGDYDKLEKAARKFNKGYTLVGDVALVKKSDKTYSLESGDGEGLEAALEEVRKFVGFAFPYEELANFRDEADIVKLLEEADGTKVDKSVLGSVTPTAPSDGVVPIVDEPAPDVDLKF